MFIDRAPYTKLHKREQKDRTKTSAEFPNHVLKDYVMMYTEIASRSALSCFISADKARTASVLNG